MKIANNPNIARIAQTYGAKLGKSENIGAKSNVSDKIEISEAAKDFQTAMKAFKELPDIREDKVGLLKAKIDSGSYNVSGSDVAGRILETIRASKE